jgi:hypothetical protein
MKCVKCNVEINGGCYKTPDGTYCGDCWDKETLDVKGAMVKDALTKMFFGIN